ncbi:calcium:proton antiporter [Acidocella sp.]|uniref:calcium:proton antiporter n=1 Tax=Acidocella sp. TaxID=50710 RepID=UPI003D04BCF5
MRLFPWWSLCFPLLALLLLGANSALHFNGPALLLLIFALGGTVFSAVHYAEVIAHKVGEPFGTLVLAVAVTVIEVALIVSVLISDGAENGAVARDTIFSAIMIVCTGVVGLCVAVGAGRHMEQGLNVKGSAGALSVLMALSVLTLVLPDFTASPGPTFNIHQLEFVGVVSLVLYAIFVFVQTVRHRDYFLTENSGSEAHHPPPPTGQALAALGVLILCLVAVVALAKSLSPTVEAFVEQSGAPKSVVGLVIAGFVLLPESLAALRAALRDKLQTSLNLAFGSVIASIGLTIPVVAAVSIWMGRPLTLGLDQKEIVLLVLTLLLSMMTVQTGRTTILQGALHLTVFAVFLFFAVVP